MKVSIWIIITVIVVAVILFVSWKRQKQKGDAIRTGAEALKDSVSNIVDNSDMSPEEVEMNNAT